MWSGGPSGGRAGEAVMNFDFSEKEEAFRKDVRHWLETHLPDDLRGRSFAASRADRDEVRRLRAWQKTMSEAGYVGMDWPREFGGRGASIVEMVILYQEMARAESPQFVNRGGISMLGPTLMKHGTPAQQARFLPKILTAEELWCQDLRQEARLLRRRSVLHERRAEHRDAAAVHELRRLRARHLLVEDDHLDDRRPAPAELARPVHADVARLGHRLLPGAEPPDLVAVGARSCEGSPAQVVGQMGLEPVPDVLAKRLFLFAEVEVHDRLTRAAAARLARPHYSQTRLACACGSHDHIHRLASRRASPSLRGRRSARTTT